MNPTHWADEAQRVLLQYAVPIGGKILGAILLWIVGRLIISGVKGVVARTLESKKLDDTLSRYLRSALDVVLTLLLFIAILGVFGVETTTFAGVLAAAGVAIGMAWAGLLSNFAAGVFLIALRPFKVGDMVTAGDVTGVVKEIGLFACTLDTGDNIRNFVGNAKIFASTIQNYTANPFRRVDLKAQLAHGVDPAEAARQLRERVAKIPNVMKDPAPSVEIIDFTPMGAVLGVRPFCHNDHYWDVFFATNQAIVEVATKAGWPVPETHHFVKKA